ncbi:thioredoxin domain-containing protein [Achromobacter sp. F4_2707]|uniref:thioredoxin family protein n=1 Tax=Achromobacter sp. F4_2707 TaxID=3114286 RepID=UPI0039C641EE
MNFFDAQTELPALAKRLASHRGLVVVCYCAAWCDTCSGYLPGFKKLAASHPEHLFAWVDIEENEALLDDEEVENFPTVLVQSPDGNLFFGPMLPHPEHLQRLLQSMDAGRPTQQEGPALLKNLI